MKHLLTFAVITGIVSTSYAREPMLAPGASIPVNYQAEQYSPTPVAEHSLPAPGYVAQPAHSGSVVYPAAHGEILPGVIVCDMCDHPPVQLWRKTIVRQERNIHPCAVPKIVSVPDPCDKCSCVFIEVCVPPCGCECVTYNRRGNSVKFDYGQYAVNVTARRGLLIVNYDD